jgi:glycerophosphoryl diester phosphodiesterase
MLLFKLPYFSLKNSMKRYTTLSLFFVLISFYTMAQKVNSSWNNNMVIAHRGAWKQNNLPENSIAALKQAIKLKCYGAEFDIHMTLDSVIVINHDHDFMGIPIAKTAYQTLLTKKLANGESIPTLENYLKTGMKQKRTKLILEIKPQKLNQEIDLKLTRKVVAMVKDLKAEAWVEFISFGYDICREIIVQMPKASVAYLGGEIAPEKLKTDGLTGFDYHFSVLKKNDWIASAKSIGLTTNVWTVNSAEDMQWFVDQQIDFITTNEPELLFKLLKAK